MSSNILINDLYFVFLGAIILIRHVDLKRVKSFHYTTVILAKFQI